MNRVPRTRASIAAAVTLAGLVVGATGTPAAAGTGTFSSTVPMTVQDPAQDYPAPTTITPGDGDAGGATSSLSVTGLVGEAWFIAVELHGVTAARPDDLDITLVAPDGTAVPLLSDAGGSTPVAAAELEVADDANGQAPDDGPLIDGTSYLPTDDEPGEPLPTGAGTGASSLHALQGVDPNGTWSLHVVDDQSGAPAQLAAGWDLYLETDPTTDPFPTTIAVTGQNTYVTDVDLTLTGVSHDYPDDLDMVLVGPDGTSSTVLSDVGGPTSASGLTLHLDDQAGALLPDNTPLSSGTFRARDVDDPADDPDLIDGDGTGLSVFNGIDPNGPWSLYVLDDENGQEGTIAGWSLNITTAEHAVAPTIASDLDGAQLDDSGATITGTGAPGNQIALNGLASTVYKTVVGSNGTWSIATSDVPDGTYSVTAVASDLYGHSLASDTRRVTFVSALSTATVSILTTAGQPAVRINRPQVLIHVTTSSLRVVGLRVSNDGAPYGSLIAWNGHSDVPWTLGSHDGTRRIFVQLQTDDGRVSGNLSTTVALDQTPPRVSKASPVAGATGVRHGKAVRARLTEAVDPYYATHGSAVLYRKGSTKPVQAVLRYDPDTLTISIHPTHRLRAATRYRVVVTGSRDLAGNWFDQDPTLAGRQRMVWRFRTR